MTGLLAHGGTTGAVIEIAAALAIVVLGLAFWIGNRRDPDGEDSGEE